LTDIQELPVIDTTSHIPGVRYLTTRDAVADFFDMVMGGALAFPAVVVTRPSHATTPNVPLEELHTAVGEHADVYYLDSPVDIRDVVRSPGLDAVDVYGGAVRVFPTGRWEWAKLFLARTPEDGMQRVSAIAAHLRGLRHAAPTSYSTSTKTAEIPVITDAMQVVDLTARLADVTARLARAEAAARPAPAKPAPRPRPGVEAVKPARRMFANAEDEIRHRVLVLWAEQTTPQEKADQPLPSFAVAESFGPSVDDLTVHTPVLLDKIARAVLRVLLGQDRDAHKLDVNGGGRLTREDGAVPWRSYVEQKTPSARRLHFFKLPGGGIELSRVVLHDDYTP
jgi:hypothetical protein